MFGTAGAVGFAFTAALTKVVTDYVARRLGRACSGTGRPTRLAVFGVVAVFLTQNAYHAGPIAASQSALVLVDPLASILIGMGLFGDNLRTAGAWGPLEALSLLVLFVGAVTLCPLAAGQRGHRGRFGELRTVDRSLPVEAGSRHLRRPHHPAAAQHLIVRPTTARCRYRLSWLGAARPLSRPR